ncbi:MAG: hypothetical protein ABIV28_08580 [Longimicrobiales bacterium]
MSRAFVKEDDDQYEPVHTFALPAPGSPGYAAAAARVLLDAARDNVTAQAEAATGYRWGHPDLKPFVAEILRDIEALPFEEQDRRTMQVARRYLRAAVAE